MARHRRVPRPSNHKFAEVPRANIPRSQFDRSFGLKTTMNAGFLVPVYVDEALPGDTFNVRMQGFARMATPLKPIMDNLYLDTFFFAVPNRLVWDNWRKFNGERRNPEDSTDFLIPIVRNALVVESQSLADYMGIPLGTDFMDTDVSALPFRAYRLIWNEWFRDENLQDSTNVSFGDGPDSAGYGSPDTASTNAGAVRRRGKRHDYFTSALPWPQKGESVPLPLGTEAPIFADAPEDGYVSVFSTIEDEARRLRSDAFTDEILISATAGDPGRGLYADLTAATAASINELRQAFQVQKLLERDARGGTRYTEIIRSHFGVTSPDQRLQRPEYLGGGSSPVTISPVAQTSSTDATTPQANLSGIGTVSFGGHGFSKSFTEHCIILGLACIRADLNYQQGLERMWSRRTRYDFYWPALAHIGEQAVLNKEIYLDPTDLEHGEEVFGYQERYAEYRYKPSQITGKFRSGAPGTLDIWHLAQNFTTAPALNSAFIQERPPVDRVIAVVDEPHFLFDAFFRIKAARPMPVYGVPGLIDHF